MGKKLLIIGAGGHGRVVAEVAQDCGYAEIAFIDDNISKAIGKIQDLEKYKSEYEYAFVAIGNNSLRIKLLDLVKGLGYKIPVLVHSTAYVSKSCEIKEGSIIEPKAIVNTNTVIGQGCIISVGAIVDHDVVVGKCCHINAGSVVIAGSVIEDYYKLDAGEVFSGVKTVKVSK